MLQNVFLEISPCKLFCHNFKDSVCVLWFKKNMTQFNKLQYIDGKEVKSAWLSLPSKGYIILRINNGCICFINIRLVSLPTKVLLLSRTVLSFVKSAVSFWLLDKSLLVDMTMESVLSNCNTGMQQNPQIQGSKEVISLHIE